MYLSVKTACSQQCLVEHIHTVGGCQDDDTAVGAKAVHLCEQGVERILTLVVATHGRIFASCPSHGIYLIYEDDARRLLLCLAEHVAHTTGTHADEHFDEVGTTHREERHAGFTGYGLGQQRLTCSGRADEQCSLGYLSAQVCVFLRVLQELYNLFYLLLGTGLSGHILKGYAQIVAFFVHLGLRLAHVEHATSA